MNLRIEKKHIILLVLSIIILISTYLFVHFTFIQPLQNKKAQAEETLKVEKQLFEKVKQKVTNETFESQETSYKLQQQIPVEPLYDQLFAELEEARTVSNTIIEQYQIITDEEKSSDHIVEQFQLDLRENTKEKNVDKKEGATSVTLEKATISVMVYADNYEEMTTFIQNLEENERVITIDELKYMDEENENYFSFQLTFSAFYVKGLDDLKKESPKIDVPEPSKKENPLKQS